MDHAPLDSHSSSTHAPGITRILEHIPEVPSMTLILEIHFKILIA